MPKERESLERSMEWSIVSKAAERSNRIRAETCLCSKAVFRSFWMRSRAVSVECSFRNADWKRDSEGKESRCLESLERTTFSRILDMKFRLEIGR